VLFLLISSSVTLNSRVEIGFFIEPTTCENRVFCCRARGDVTNILLFWVRYTEFCFVVAAVVLYWIVCRVFW